MTIISFSTRQPLPDSQPRGDYVAGYNDLRNWHFKHRWMLDAETRLGLLNSLQLEIEAELVGARVIDQDWRQRIRDAFKW